uniref:Uncharacterized protein n=1 Tax=Heliothis virescens TaxID=7102 RepID=A0A2A4K4Y5_HELVI
MIAIKVNSVRKMFAVVILLTCISSSCCVNVKIKPNEHKPLNPVLIKKYLQNSPLIMSTKSEDGELFRKIPAKPPPMKRSLSKLLAPKRLTRSLFTVPKLPLVPFFLPLIPKTPLLPMFPHLLAPPVGPSFPMHQPITRLSHLLGWEKQNDKLLDKLLDLKRKRVMTAAEYLKFKKLLY